MKPFRNIQVVLTLLAGLVACSSATVTDGYLLRYDFSKPQSRIDLPAILNEISGQVILDDSTIACVQDENGIIFLFDTRKNSIRQQIAFAGDGDYEGICLVRKDLYILQSDGVLYRVIDFAAPAPRSEQFVTGIPADNSEGLCYDSLENRLLIACKSRIGEGKEDKDLRAVYAFDLATMKLQPEPAYEFFVTEALEFADAHDIPLPQKEKKKGTVSVLKFRMSAIGIHPVTGELYILSAVDHALFIYNRKPQETGAGEMLHMELLDESKFNKAEGISFYPNGDVLISNEAQDKKPTLMKFSYQEAK